MESAQHREDFRDRISARDIGRIASTPEKAVQAYLDLLKQLDQDEKDDAAAVEKAIRLREGISDEEFARRLKGVAVVLDAPPEPVV